MHHTGYCMTRRRRGTGNNERRAALPAAARRTQRAAPPVRSDASQPVGTRGGATDPSLRARKKETQQRLLLDAAAELFRRQGYEATRVEDVAAYAEVSTKTVYNYFPTKQGLIIGLLNRDRERLRGDYERVLEAPPDDPAEGLAALIRADVGDVETSADKRLWRDLLAAATRGHSHARDDFESNRRHFTRYIARLLQHYIERGALSRELPLDVAVDLVYAVNAFDFREFCAAEGMTPADLLVQARRQMQALLEGWRPARGAVRRAKSVLGRTS